jgi:hypothetical protein
MTAICGPLTEPVWRDAERAYAQACADPYFNDGDDAYDNHWRASLAVIRDYEAEAGGWLLSFPDEAYAAAWTAAGVERAHRWEFA